MPHEPGIFDRRTKQFSTSPSADYLDNLVLVDQVLGQLRVAMERRGTWDSSAVLLTSDHPLRAHMLKGDNELSRVAGQKMHPYVPFLLKMPGQTNGLKWEGPIMSIVSQDLILSFLRGRLREPQDAVAWLRDHGEPGREDPRTPEAVYAHVSSRSNQSWKWLGKVW
jgi:arylsulfatase A-like enzyme